MPRLSFFASYEEKTARSEGAHFTLLHSHSAVTGLRVLVYEINACRPNTCLRVAPDCDISMLTF